MARMVRLDGLRTIQLVGCITVDPTSERSAHLGLLLVSACCYYSCRDCGYGMGVESMLQALFSM